MEECALHCNFQNKEGIAKSDGKNDEQIEAGFLHSDVKEGEKDGGKAVQANEKDNSNGGEQAQIGQELNAKTQRKWNEILANDAEQEGHTKV
jgi:hypothetical protein